MGYETSGHKPPNEFERAAAASKAGNILGELWHFLRTNRKWWLVPILVSLLLLGSLMLLSSTAVAPFIYMLF